MLARCVHESEIPDKYKGYITLGRGTTTIAKLHSEDDVLLFVRDPAKTEWLLNIGIAKHIDVHNSNYHPIKGMTDYNIEIMLCDRLYPISRENKKEVFQMCAFYRKIYYILRANERHRVHYSDSPVRTEIENCPFPQIRELFQFLHDNWGDDFMEYVGLDVAPRNFKQTKDGKVILLDPVIDIGVLNLCHKHHSEKATRDNERAWGYQPNRQLRARP